MVERYRTSNHSNVLLDLLPNQEHVLFNARNFRSMTILGTNGGGVRCGKDGRNRVVRFVGVCVGGGGQVE